MKLVPFGHSQGLFSDPHPTPQVTSITDLQHEMVSMNCDNKHYNNVYKNSKVYYPVGGRGEGRKRTK